MDRRPARDRRAVAVAVRKREAVWTGTVGAGQGWPVLDWR